MRWDPLIVAGAFRVNNRAFLILTMVRIAVTGGVACGKSHVGKCLVARGVSVWEADETVHELLRPGTAVFDRVVDTFGAGILDQTGMIDRRILGAQVFADADSLARLNSLIHPVVIEVGRAWLESCRARTVQVAAAVVPLLFEVGWTEGWDCVVCVVCPPDVQDARMRARGWSDEERKARVASQWPQDRKASLADVVVVSDGPPILVENQVSRMLDRVAREIRYVR